MLIVGVIVLLIGASTTNLHHALAAFFSDGASGCGGG
jgi:hypothetical protein